MNVENTEVSMKRLLMSAVMFAALASPAIGRATGAAEVVRTVYFSAVDGSGKPVTDLAAADLAVKENGKERAIRGVEPATGPLQVSLLVDDGGSGAFQGPVAQFLETMLGHAQVAIRVFNPQPSKVTDFTEDVNALKAALNGIGPRGKVATTGEQMPGAIEEAAQELQKRNAARPAIVVVTVGGEQAQSVQAEPTLNALKNSGASLNVVYLSGLELGQVLGDGPKRSGGLIQPVGGSVVPGPVLAKVADTLLHQYALTYTLPDGVKPNEKLALTTTRKGVTLVAPSRVPDK
jgi:hypothetical protein